MAAPCALVRSVVAGVMMISLRASPGRRFRPPGFSIGVSRLYSALKLVGKAEETATLAPVVVLVLDKDRQGDYWRMVQQLRAASIRAEMYVGTAGMKAQMKYADKRGRPLVIIQGGDEKAKGEVQIKDLALGLPTRLQHRIPRGICQPKTRAVLGAESDLVSAVQKALGAVTPPSARLIPAESRDMRL